MPNAPPPPLLLATTLLQHTIPPRGTRFRGLLARLPRAARGEPPPVSAVAALCVHSWLLAHAHLGSRAPWLTPTLAHAPLGSCAPAFSSLVHQSEQRLANHILSAPSPENWHSSFLSAVAPAVDDVCATGSTALIELQARTKDADPEGLLAALDLAQTGREVLPACRRLLRLPATRGRVTSTVSRSMSIASMAPDGRQLLSHQPEAHLDGLQGLLVGAAHSALVNYQEVISQGGRGAQAKQITPDATVHPLTSSTMHLLRRLMEFQPTVDWLLANKQQLAATSTKDYSRGVLRDHVQSLQSRAHAVKDKFRAAVPHLFLLNNLHYITSNIRTGFNDQPTAVRLQQFVGDELLRVWDQLSDVNKEKYFAKSWDQLLPFLDDPVEPLQPQRGSKLLTLESGRVLKAKFEGFNNMLTQLHIVFCQCSVPDPGLRALLVEEAVSKVANEFGRFHAQFSIVPFSKKNQAKYLRYTPDDVERLLREAYGGVTIATGKGGDDLQQQADDDSE